MGSIGTWWVKGFPARDGERTSEGFYANRLRDAGRPIGGKLYVTNERVLFAPHFVDAILGGERHEIDLAAIEALDLAEERSEGGSSGLRVQVTDNSVERFIVNDREDALAAIEAERDG